MQRYFLEESYCSGQETVQMSGAQAHQILHVLRMEVGAQAVLVFREERSFLAEISAIEGNAVTFSLLEEERQEKELPTQVSIAHSFPKGEKLEWIVQKSAELGAYSVIAFPSKRSIVKWDAKKLAKKQERLAKIATEAAEQSGRTHAPSVELLPSKQELFQKWKSYDLVIVAYEELAKQGERARFAQLLAEVVHGSKILAIFGPEGGFSPSEIEEFVAHQAVVVGLGPRILRTETAPLYFLSAVSYELELRRNQ